MIRFPYEIVEFINKQPSDIFFSMLSSDYTLAFLLYYSKWLLPQYQKILHSKVFAKFISFNKRNSYGVPYALMHYSKKTQYLIMNNIGFLQTNFGCTKGCYFCGSDAVFFKKPISIPFYQLKYLIKHFAEDLKKNYTYFYWASDPLDYSFRNKNYKSVLNLCKRYLKKVPYTSTAIRNDNFLLYQKIIKQVNRVSYLGSDKQLYNQVKDKINDSSYDGFSLKEIRYNGLWGYKNQKYDNGILCLNGTLLTPFFAYNLVNIGRCNNFFPQGLLAYPISRVDNQKIKSGDNLLDCLTRKIVLYDYVDYRSQRGRFDKIVVFLRDYEKIYLVICSKGEMGKGVIRILNVIHITLEEYNILCFSKKGQQILYNIESNE